MKESVSAWPNSNPAFRPETSTDVERKIRVAFVEDDDDYREAVSSELGDHGFDVTTFSDGAALSMARSSKRKKSWNAPPRRARRPPRPPR